MSKFSTPAAEENVGCNLIPMIDIMFLLLLFFMLGADMTQRELAEVVLPRADKCQEDKKEKTGSPRTTINVYHRPTSSAFACAAHDAGGICRENAHWLIDVRKHEYTRETLKALLQIEADREREPPRGPGEKPLSAQKVMIRADFLAPFGHIQRVIEACASVGIYKIEVGAARPSPTTP